MDCCVVVIIIPGETEIAWAVGGWEKPRRDPERGIGTRGFLPTNMTTTTSRDDSKDNSRVW